MKSTRVLAWIGAALQLGQKSHFYAKPLVNGLFLARSGSVRIMRGKIVGFDTTHFILPIMRSSAIVNKGAFLGSTNQEILLKLVLALPNLFLLQMVGFNWTNNPALSLILFIGSCNDQHQNFDHYDQCVWTLDYATWCWWEDSMPLCQSRSGAWEPLSVGNLCTF